MHGLGPAAVRADIACEVSRRGQTIAASSESGIPHDQQADSGQVRSFEDRTPRSIVDLSVRTITPNFVPMRIRNTARTV